tara:strand:+ start:1161 stop:1667 length:507 start_codon:yes stop_codon:yes gene_type:complete
MAVPTSGAISMLGLAQEALYGTYGSGTITDPIHLYDLVNGGDTAGSGNDYPTVNDDCTPNPVTRGSTPLLQIYKVQQGQSAIGPLTLYVNSADAATASDLSDGDVLFTDSSLQTLFGEWRTIVDGDYKYLYQITSNLTSSQRICPDSCNQFETDSFSVVTINYCDACP